MKKITLSLIALAASAMIATAQAPARFNYQGIARNSSGAALASKTLGMRITIHDGSASGPTVYQETTTATTNPYGLYNVAIGSGTVVSGTLSGANWGSGDKYIQVELDPNGGSSYTADLGTTQLMSVPYAMYANAAPLTLTGSTLSAGGNSISLPGGFTGTQYYLPKFATSSTLGNSTIYETAPGKIGIGTTAPLAKVHISNSADSIGLYVESSYGGTAVKYAIAAENTTTSTSTTNPPVGVYCSAVPSASSNNGQGLLAYGSNVGAHNIGLSTATSFSTGSNVFGSYNISYTNIDAIGAYGTATSYSGTTGSGTKIGVYGAATGGTTNYAGYFGGNVAVVGSLAKSAGSFKIDHPLDPDNKYLYHSFVESPDMMNVYNGNITTDASGFATVTLPDYFEALNKDFRYQLTVIGTFAQAIVKEKVSSNHFRIQTNQPNVEVSWQVTGIRQDAYANAHRIQTEVEKETVNKGKYLHPAELGKPADREINYELNHPKAFNADKMVQEGAGRLRQ